MAQQVHSSDVPNATADEWAIFQENLIDAYAQIGPFFFQDHLSGAPAKNPNGGKNFMRLQQDFMVKLMEKFTSDERGHCLAFHHFIASTTSYTNSPILDFPGEYSILGFYNRIISEYVRPGVEQEIRAEGPSI